MAVIRLSGAESLKVLRLLSGKTDFIPRRARFLTLRDPIDQEIIDQTLVFYFAAPASETGEDCAEIQCHGAPTVITRLLEILGQIPGLRLAEPGEFTRRALLNHRLDLTAVEGLADLVAADTQVQRQLAISQMSGKMSARFDRWSESLTLALGLSEALIDFAEEEIPDSTVARIAAIIATTRTEIHQQIGDQRRGEILRDGIRLALIGSVNVGKSSLLNHLAGREAAIVSHHPGTTRDVIEVGLEIAGYKVLLSDTAGIRDSSDPIEQIGIGLSRDRAAQSDLILHMVDATELAQKSPEELETHGFHQFGKFQINLINKIDLCRAEERTRIDQLCASSGAVAISIKNQQNLDQLWQRIEAGLINHFQFDPAEPPLITRHRHREIAGQILASLDSITPGMERELVAEELRHSVRLIGRITGKIGVEQLLDVIFSEFCLGK